MSKEAAIVTLTTFLFVVSVVLGFYIGEWIQP